MCTQKIAQKTQKLLGVKGLRSRSLNVNSLDISTISPYFFYKNVMGQERRIYILILGIKWLTITS